MKSSEDNLDRWLGLPVYKAEVKDHGVETHIQGKVMRYSRSSKRFSLLYTDGSSDEVSVDDIEDHLPLRLQFKEKKHARKRCAESLQKKTEQSSTKRPRLPVSEAGKSKRTQNEPKQADKLEVMSRFVQDTLWALTTVLHVNEEKQQALLTTLNTRDEQPFAALKQYAKEGGLVALHKTLQEYAREKEVAGETEANTNQHALERETPQVTQDSKSKRTSHGSTHRGRCDKHLQELLQASFSPRSTQPKEQHAPHKPEPRHKKSLHKNQESEEEEADRTRSRLRFSTVSTIRFDQHASVRVFHLQVKRAERKRMLKSLRKSVLKTPHELVWSVASFHCQLDLRPAFGSPTTAMNYGIINNRRPDPRKREAASVNALLADPRMREIAKQMGLQPKDFGEEAQALWNTLNDLSTSDPKRYEFFINEQLQDGPPSEASNQSATDAPRFFTPEPGFVVKCCMYHSIKCQQKETKLFVNICAHTLIDAPKNPNSGLQVPDDTRDAPNTNNLQVPLVVGKLRESSDLSGAVCCVVDVVVNPWVLRRCEWDANFKRETMKLAVQWVQEDARVRLVTPTGKFIKARYKGGVSVGSEIITSKFRIEDADPTKQRMESPADLLKQINMDEAEKDEDTHELKIRPSKENSTANAEIVLNAEQLKPPPAPVEAKPQKKLIEELPSPTSKPKNTVQTAAGRSKQNTKRAAKGNTKTGGAVKRGFLNSSKTPLYPKGSSEGRPSSAYVNLLSRSKVVDLGEMEKQQKGPNQKQMTTSSGSDEIDHSDHIFDQLCEQAEPDLKTTSTTRTDTNNGDQLFGEGFEELAKLLAP